MSRARLPGDRTLRLVPGRRPKTDMYLTAIEAAVATPGRWVEIPRRFNTQANVLITARCLERGYLRVRPRNGDVPMIVDGQRYIKTAAPVDTRPREVGDGWQLGIRFISTLTSRSSLPFSRPRSAKSLVAVETLQLVLDP